MMRKPRDYDAEMKALADKARQLKTRRQTQLGELVIACGADRLEMEMLAGALLAAAQTSDKATKEAWRRNGATFFSGARQASGRNAGAHAGRVTTDNGSVQSPPAEPGTT